ncbi:MAG: hypothetical protein U1D30_04195 [Planctomycetota bacterium]
MMEAVVTGLAVEFGSRLPLAEGHAHNLLVPTSLSTVFTGFLVLISRRDAIRKYSVIWCSKTASSSSD